MRFGGHQTFVIRDGWLFKGLRVLRDDPSLFGTEYLQDHLGVGKNMAKAIEHWLLAAGLARLVGVEGRKRVLAPTELGDMIWQYDRYMIDPTSWWLIHTQLTHNRRLALTWNWFFNHFGSVRFERGTVVESLRRRLQIAAVRPPSPKTLERDVACMLRTYAEVLPRDVGDPEDLYESPLTRLGLMSMSRHSGYFRVDRGIKQIPFPVFGYAVSRAFSISGDDRKLDVSLTELTHREGAPGRIFCLSAEAIYDLIARFEAEGESRLTISSQAGERVVRLKTQPADDWMEEALSSAPVAAFA
jgi:hypothetical protein